MRSICVLVGMLLLVGCCSAQAGVPHMPKITLSFVVDVTGSMSSEINHVRNAIKNATYHLEAYKHMGIDHFILVTFSDPAYKNKIYEFFSLHALYKGTSIMRATGGGDCPEYGFDGLLKAITKSYAHSYIFYFSDASAKDAYRAKDVISSARAKNITIWIISTGCCTHENCVSSTSVYRNVANSTNGQLYSVTVANLPSIMRFVNQNIRCRSMYWLRYPPANITALHEWLRKHPDCSSVHPTPYPTRPHHTYPPVAGASGMSINAFSVVMATAVSMLAFLPFKEKWSSF